MENPIEKSREPKHVALTMEFGTLYVSIQNGQLMKPVRALMTLYEKLNHIYKIRNVYSMTVEGYRMLNRVASISIVTPQRVTVDGLEQPNPYIERNRETKLIETIHIRKLGIGYNMVGNVVVIDKTLCYNVKTYFIQSIQAKMDKMIWKDGRATDKPMYPNCARLGVKSMPPEIPGSWVFFKIESPLGIWINYEDPAIFDCLEEHSQRQRFGDRIAQTIVERNILKDHPAIGISTVDTKLMNGLVVAHVPVYGYRQQLTPHDINDIIIQAELGAEIVEVKAETIKKIPIEEETEALQDASRTEDSPEAVQYATPGVSDPSGMTEEEAAEQAAIKEKESRAGKGRTK